MKIFKESYIFVWGFIFSYRGPFWVIKRITTFLVKKKKVTYPSARDNVDSIFGMIKSLNHCYESRTSITFFIYTCQIVMHLYHTLFHTKMFDFLKLYHLGKILILSRNVLSLFFTRWSSSATSFMMPLNQSKEPCSLVTQ